MDVKRASSSVAAMFASKKSTIATRNSGAAEGVPSAVAA
jgi:hypothetical protein